MKVTSRMDVVSVAGKAGNWPCFRTIREAFGSISPLFLVIGITALFGYLLSPVMGGDALSDFRAWEAAAGRGLLDIVGLVICALVAFRYSSAIKAEGVDPLFSVILAMACLVVCTPLSKAFDSVALGSGLLGYRAIVLGILVGLAVTWIHGRLAASPIAKASFPEFVPPAVGQVISSAIPPLVIIVGLSVAEAAVETLSGACIAELVSTKIQGPLVAINTSIVGCILISSLANLLFCKGVHQSTLSGILLEPFLLCNICENMAASLGGGVPVTIVNWSFVQTFGLLGGSGSTLCLVIVSLLISRDPSRRQVASDAVSPGLFNINEPVIFGYPVMGDSLLMIPFVLAPALGLVIGYVATVAGIIPVAGVYVPWICPPLLNAFLSCGLSLAAVGVQFVALVVGALVYLPFLKVSERRLAHSNGKGETEAV